MAELRFQLDEHMHHAIARALRRRGIDVITTGDADLIGATDEHQLAHGRVHGRVIVTHDDDFLRLHSQGRQHAGIAYFPRTRAIGEIVTALFLLHDVYDSADMTGRVEYL